MKFYLTTPLYYVNDSPHLGTTYTQIAVDTLARYHRLAGKKVLFLTGTDEHGQKVEEAARQQNKKPQDFVDQMVPRFQNLWKRLQISYDDFIRTTEVRHIKVAQEVFQKLYDSGDIYKGLYRDWYCTPCESFVTESQLVEGKCPECQGPVKKVSEETYFFKLSRYEDRLLKHFEENPNFVQPPSRQQEVTSFIKSGLRDLSVSRSTFSWGIPVPFDPKHVVYVWFEALLNYITACGYNQDQGKFSEFWPADVQIIGKDILKFHATLWPAMLMAIGIEVPKKVFAHGWWTVRGEKMSKSKGNVVEPDKVIELVGVDGFRYFLLREVPFGLDGDFSQEALVQRYNSDLANDLGNLLNRTLPMIQKYFSGKVPSPGERRGLDQELISLSENLPQQIERALENLQFHQALISIWNLVKRANKYIEETAPWRLFKENNPRLSTVMYNLLEVLRIVGLLLYPFLPQTAEKIWQQLGLREKLNTQTIKNLRWGQLRSEISMGRAEPLFPRIEVG